MRSPIIAFSIMAATVNPMLTSARPMPSQAAGLPVDAKHIVARPRITEVQNEATTPLHARGFLEALSGGHGAGGFPGADLLKDPSTQSNAVAVNPPQNLDAPVLKAAKPADDDMMSQVDFDPNTYDPTGGEFASIEHPPSSAAYKFDAKEPAEPLPPFAGSRLLGTAPASQDEDAPQEADTVPDAGNDSASASPDAGKLSDDAEAAPPAAEKKSTESAPLGATERPNDAGSMPLEAGKRPNDAGSPPPALSKKAKADSPFPMDKRPNDAGTPPSGNA